MKQERWFQTRLENRLKEKQLETFQGDYKLNCDQLVDINQTQN